LKEDSIIIQKILLKKRNNMADENVTPEVEVPEVVPEVVEPIVEAVVVKEPATLEKVIAVLAEHGIHV
jgi:hypothetical protein